MKVICNTSPVIGLLSINRISLLFELFNEVILPKTVVDELCAKSDNHQDQISQVKKLIAEGKFTVYQVKNQEIIKKLYGKLHFGELEVIIGAKECGLPLAVIDEIAARKVAAEFLIDTIGIIGILSLAKKKGLLSQIKPDLDLLRSKGYRISNSLYETSLQRNDEG